MPSYSVLYIFAKHCKYTIFLLNFRVYPYIMLKRLLKDKEPNPPLYLENTKGSSRISNPRRISLHGGVHQKSLPHHKEETHRCPMMRTTLWEAERAWRREGDSNPRYGFMSVWRFSKPLPSASRPPLHAFDCTWNPIHQQHRLESQDFRSSQKIYKPLEEQP